MTKERLQQKIREMLPHLNEYQKRRYLASEAKAYGYGGISLMSEISGVSAATISQGVSELLSPEEEKIELGKSRKKGGGRKPIWETQPGILEALKEIVEPHTKGDPMSTLLWTNKSLRNISKGLKERGFDASHNVIRKLLKKIGYNLQTNKKTLAQKAIDPDRNAQFEYINSETKTANKEGNPVISIDAKKKENVGNFKNNGQTYNPKGAPTEVLDHDFPIEELGKATPYGIYDIFENKGFVSVGVSKDTAVFAVESIRRWWYEEGVLLYPDAKEIVITADCGGSNGNRLRLWKFELQKFANEIGKTIRVLHYPPGTSKWNKIEHRLFSFISINWQGIPLVSIAIILSLIGTTTTETGLSVTAVLDDGEYATGIEVSKADYNAINLVRDEFRGDWNYRITPST